MNVLVTGSSGYVASNLVPYLKQNATIFGVDQSLSKHSDLQGSIESSKFKDFMGQFRGEEIVIINLAAARFDFGATARDYYRLNVECHQIFT